MREFFRKLFHSPEPPLSGAPSRPRIKTYSADSGYVYEYVLEGFRRTGGAHAGFEYRFCASGDRKNWISVVVFAPEAVLNEWEQEHGRDLSASERFAVAKIALRRAFDFRPHPEAMRQEIRITSTEVREIAAFLGLT